MKDADLLKILYENTSYGIEVAIDTYGKAVKTICQTIEVIIILFGISFINHLFFSVHFF